MRWFNFGILLFVTLVLQMGVARLFGLGEQRVMPDLLLLVAVVLAFRGEQNSAMIACFFLGLAKDLTGQAVLGSYAIGFGLLGWIIVRARDLFYGEHPITLIMITLAAGFFVEQLVLAICLMKKVFSWDNYGVLTLSILFSAVLTAGLSPYGQWLLLKFHRWLGLPRRRSYGR